MSEEIIVLRDLSVISAEINEIKANTSGMLRACEAYTKQSVFEIGKRLCEAKEAVGHGNFGEFLETVDYSTSTANNLMRIYNEMGNDEAFNALSYSQLVALFALPVGERKALLPDIEDKSSREIKELVKQLDQAKAENEELSSELDEADAKREEVWQKLEAVKGEKKALEKTNASLSADLKKAENEASLEKKKHQDLEKELEEYKSKPLPVRDLTEAELREISDKARAEVKVELEKQIAKDALKSDPVLVEVQILLKQSLEGLMAVSALLSSWENKEMSTKTKALVLSKFDTILADLRKE